MKSLIRYLILLVIVGTASAQSVGDYRSRGNGNWKDASTWSTWNGSSWVNATTKPDYATNVTIHDEDVVTLTAPGLNQYNECANLTVQSGYLVGNEGLFVFGNISVSNNAQIGDATYPIIIISGTTCEMSGLGAYYLGGLWKYDHWAGEVISTLTIASGTTINYKGTADGIFIKNDDADTRFNITVNGAINCATGTIGNNGYISFDGSNGAGSSSCGGSLTVSATGVVNAGQIYLMNNNTNVNQSTSLNIYGTVNCRMFTFSNSGTAGASLRIYDGGILDIKVGGSFGSSNNTATFDNGSKVIFSNNDNQTVLPLGNFYYLEMDGTNGPINRTLGGNIGVNGKLTLKGTTSIVSGGYSITYGSGASLEYIGTTHTTSSAEWPSTLDKNILINTSGKVTLNGNKSSYSGILTFSSGELDLAAFEISGTGSFNMTGSTKIYTTHANGIGSLGNFQLSGTQTFSSIGSYEYNSSTDHQYTGNLLPSSVSNFIISNSKTNGIVYLSNNLIVNSTFTRKRGILNLNGSSLTYGASAGLLYDNGITVLTAGDEFPSTMNGTVTLSGIGIISIYGDRSIDNSLTIDAGSRLWVPANRILEVNGNIINNGTIDGESSSKIYFGGNNLTNGSSALIDPYEFYFTKSGEQTAVGLNKFHATVHTKINSGSITSFGDSETLSLDYGSLTILSGGRLNISGTVTITGEGNIYDYGTLYVNSLSTLLINGDNGENTSTALTLNVYTNQITGSDGSLRFTGYCQILAQNNGSITGGSLNLILESGTLYLGPNTGSETEIIINGGFANYGGTFTTSPSIIIFNSDIVNAGTSNISRVDFRGSTITNTGNLNILYFLHFNSGGTQTVNGLTNLNIAVEGKVKGTTKLILDNQYSTPEEQVLTLGNSCTFTIEENAEIEIDGSVTITGSTGCSSVPNDNCGNLIKYGKITINSGKRLDITCGEVQIHNTSFLGSGTLGLGQETTSSDLRDNTFINLNVGYIESPSLTVEILEGGCVEIVGGFNFVGPVRVKGILRVNNGCSDLCLFAASFNNDVTLFSTSRIGRVNCAFVSVLDCGQVVFSGNVINGSSEFLVSALNGTSQQSFSGNFEDLEVNNSSGVTLSANASVKNLTLTNGSINTGANLITIGTATNDLGTYTRSSGTVIGNVKRWFNSATVNNVEFPVGTTNKYRPANISFTSAPTSGGTLTVSFVESNPGQNGLPLTDGSEEITSCGSDGFWRITTGDDFAGGTYNIDLNASGFGGINDYTKLRLLKRNDSSSPWTLAGEHVISTGSNSEPVIHRSGLTSFSEFGVGGGAANPLPVELTSFQALIIENKVILNWQTATEVNNYGFEIESSRIGHSLPVGSHSSTDEWKTVGFVAGSGNSNSPKNYSFTDLNPSIGIIRYRLKQIDFDGQFDYSNIVVVIIEVPSNFALEQNYPNPFNPETVISYHLSAMSHVNLIVYDLLGREVARLVNNQEQQPGIYNVKFNLKNEESSSSLSNGVYFYRLQAGEFVSVKKMILLK